MNKNSFKIILEDKSRDLVISFCKNVENKLHFIINTYLKASKRKSYDPISLNINLNEDRDLNDEFRNKDTVRQGKLDLKNYSIGVFEPNKKEFVFNSNILEQCD